MYACTCEKYIVHFPITSYACSVFLERNLLIAKSILMTSLPKVHIIVLNWQSMAKIM